jgi:hypothetical protein
VLAHGVAPLAPLLLGGATGFCLRLPLRPHLLEELLARARRRTLGLRRLGGWRRHRGGRGLGGLGTQWTDESQRQRQAQGDA